MRKSSLIMAAIALMTAGSALARDGWQDRPHVCDMPSGPRLDVCQDWIRTVQRPDYRGASCCGDGDAYIADNFELGPRGELYAIITADYPDPPSTIDDNGALIPPAFTVHRGDRILVPPEKVNHDIIDANKSGHGAIFIIPSNGQVICFFFPPLI